jgi:uncharacterized protein YfaS (alpha-2-macroglobulin family)
MLLLFALFLTSLTASAVTAAHSPTATYEHGSLSLQIPFHSPRPGFGRLSVEILDPENHLLGHAERSTEMTGKDGAWLENIAFETPLPVEDLLWERMRYRFTYEGDRDPAFEGTESISRILVRPVVRIIGQKSYLAGSDAAMRILVKDTNNEEIHGKGSVKVELMIPDGKPMTLFAGALNRNGMIAAKLHFPAGQTGSYLLHLTAETAIGMAECTQSIELKDKASILLTTEKPIYQPGQTIHMRALALDRAHHAAVGKQSLIFEVEDARGNKVFKKATATDEFGVASAEFTLADEVNLGAYHLRALMGQEGQEPTNRAEVTVNVERYVLPKFKVAVDFTETDGKPKKDYRPGDHVTGTVRANYFFGKPVGDAEIKIKASVMDLTVIDAATASGKTDADGNYHFDLTLPDYFAGRPISGGAARVLVEATVKDAASHAESRGEPITVTPSALLITAIPESGKLIPDVENQVFILSSYPDGTPARTSLTIHLHGLPALQVVTDDAGVAVIHLPARKDDEAFTVHAGFGKEVLHIDADDHRGSRASAKIDLGYRDGEDQILLRTEHALYRAGDVMHLKLFSSHERGAAYLDIVKDGQTILTRDVEMEAGETDLDVPVTPEMAGSLDINAYLFGRDAELVSDHRLVFVQPADELHIETVADAAEYKPGAEARVHFRVTNARGQGVSAALGVQVVDEAVFALAEKQPGFAKVFFYLEQEVMKPRFEMHSLSMEGIVAPGSVVTPAKSTEEQPRNDLAARALFSATEMTQPDKLDAEFGRELPQQKRAEFDQRYSAAFESLVREIDAEVEKKGPEHLSNSQIVKALEEVVLRDGSHPRDAWGAPLNFRYSGWVQNGMRYFVAQSGGPGHKFESSMYPLAYYILIPVEGREPQSAKVITSTASQDSSINGVVTDQTGAVIPGARISFINTITGDRIQSICGAQGFYDSGRLTPGSYTLQAYSKGFESYTQTGIVVAAHRTYRLDVKLTVGAEATTVTVISGQEAEVPVDNAEIAATLSNVLVDSAALSGRNVTELKTMAAPAEKSQLDAKTGAAAPHIRSYFPEALYINPEIITDGKGNADITIPIADSITTWRMAMLASTQAGALGTGTSILKVFQDFFVDLDLPVTLTQGDRVSIPVAVYNYSGKAGKVSLKLEAEDWFSLVNDDFEKNVPVDSGRVGSSQFTVQANHIGKFKLTIAAKMDNGKQDTVVREIEVIPNGREQNIVFNGRLESTVNHDVQFPSTAIPNASKLFVRLYPGPLSQIIEGMDSILRMPGGCFEQTSSSTYPNVLALEYMKRAKKLTPEIHAKAEGYIANGYQRLLTFEVPGGGFSWFGQAPANKILTAYGLMEFNDMAKVYDVDPKLIARTQDWLAQQQQPDGSWKPDTYFINEGATNRYNSDILRITAYIAWALENTGYKGAAAERARRYIDEHLSAQADSYTLAVIANFAIDYGQDGEFTQRTMELLLDARTTKGALTWWSAPDTGVYSTGASAAIETTGLAAQALLKWGQSAAVARQALAYIVSMKDATGAWGSTQATIVALRSIILGTEAKAGDTRGTVEIVLNGKTAQTLQLDSDNSDLFHQYVFKEGMIDDRNSVEIKFNGTGSLGYQVVGQYFIPWTAAQTRDALSIDVAYDRSRLAQNDIATATATVKNNLDKTAKMVMIDLGIPPGFELLSEDLEQLQESTAHQTNGRLEKFSLTATQAILYLNSLSPNQTITVKFRLRAKYPIRAKTFQSRAYEYYDPAISATAAPAQLEIVQPGAK